MMRSRTLQLVILATASALVLASGVSEARLERFATSTGKSFAREATPETVDIRRFAEIRPGLTRGGDPGEEGLQYLRDRGYKTIVSFLVDEAESAYVVHSGMQYVHIPMRSGLFGAQPPTDEQVSRFLSVVNDSTRYPVFIHCHAGKDRTGAMSAIYRMQACGWTADEAIDEMKAFGFSGRYKRLLKYVQGYSGHRVASSLPPDAATATSGQVSPSATSKVAAAPVVGSPPGSLSKASTAADSP